MELASVLAIVLPNGGGEPPDWPDFLLIAVVLINDATISFRQESSVANAISALKSMLAPKAKVFRDGMWMEHEASILVPGDGIKVKAGDTIAADILLLEGDAVIIDESIFSGEHLAVSKGPYTLVYCGTVRKQGEIEAVVIATGTHTGEAAHLAESTPHGPHQLGHFHKVLILIWE